MIQHKVALNAAETYAADSAWMLTAGMVDRGGIDFSLETAACKIFASELAFRAANDALQIAGGIGYSKEYPYEQAVRDARINLIFEGTNEILRALIALMALQQPGERLKELGKAFRDPLHSIGAIGSYVAGRAKRQVTTAARSRACTRRSPHEAQLGRDDHPLARLAVDALLRKHGKAIIERQFLQQRLANVAIDVYLVGRGALAHDVGDRARGQRRRRGRGARLRARVHPRRDAPRAPAHPGAAGQSGRADEGDRRAGAGDGGPGAGDADGQVSCLRSRGRFAPSGSGHERVCFTRRPDVRACRAERSLRRTIKDFGVVDGEERAPARARSTSRAVPAPSGCCPRLRVKQKGADPRLTALARDDLIPLSERSASHSLAPLTFPTKNSPNSAYCALTSSKRMSVTIFLNASGSAAKRVTPHSHASRPIAPVITWTTRPA